MQAKKPRMDNSPQQTQNIGEKEDEIFDALPKLKRATRETIQYNISTINRSLDIVYFPYLHCMLHIARSNCQ